MHELERKDPLPVKVAWLANYIPPYAAFLFKSLQARFRDFHIFVSVGMGSNRQWPVGWDGLSVYLQRTFTTKAIWSHPHKFAETTEIHFPYDTIPLLLSYKPEVIISGELGLRSLQSFFYREAFHPRCRLIIRATLSDVTELGRGRLRESLRAVLLSKADAVFVNGKSGAKYIKRFDVPDEKLFPTPSTTDLEPFLAVPLFKEEAIARRLLYVGRLAEGKGLLPFLEVLSNWAKSNPQKELEYWVVGDGPVRPKFQEFKLPSNIFIRFFGNVPYESLPEIYSQADLFVFPTLADEWGMVVNEALAAGVPVLGSLYSQAVEELIREGINGWTFRPDNAEETLLALDRALNSNEDVLTQMRSAARASIEHMTPEFVAQQIADAVSCVLGRDDSGLKRAAEAQARNA